MDVLDEYVARMVERGEAGFRALLDRPGALRYLSLEKLDAQTCYSLQTLAQLRAPFPPNVQLHKRSPLQISRNAMRLMSEWGLDSTKLTASTTGPLSASSPTSE